ncbi:DNA adenine methylase [Lysobacter sp. Hz 25]|uniref:DNA adenine methylase n=1 Tax=Lysobacter sp. Hz 25 TaxID=3383698 RepID=UPI0038D41716
MSNSQIVLPFLKWAGGKRWLANNYGEVIDLHGAVRYVEPFLGSGAVFFSVNPGKALLNDANRDLVGAYRTIKEDWKSVYSLLQKYHRKHDVDFYYEMRNKRPVTAVGRAARFIYLNRTCFNGLYRVNKQGCFNVPVGTKSSVVLDTDDFRSVASRLKCARLVSGDFEKVVNECGVGDFLYVDPPYTVKHNNNGFVKYNERLFSWSDQERLASALMRAVSRGARAVVSNADHPSIRELYNGCDQIVAERHSVMASESARRKKTTELVIFLR